MAEELKVEGQMLERLAAAAHEVYCAGKRRDGWVYGPVRDNAKKVHPLLKPYEELEETYKEANRVTVRSIPRKLAAAGHRLSADTGVRITKPFTSREIERMAEVEHEVWMEGRLTEGFRLGEPTASDAKRSPYLVPWAALTEDVREVDREMVRGIVDVVREAGLVVVRE